VMRGNSRWIAAGRGLLAVVFLAGATYNGVITLRSPAAELGRLIALSRLPIVRDLAGHIALTSPTLFVLLVMLLEVAIAVSSLLPGVVRRAGYVAALAFFCVLAPLIGWYALTNLVWAVPAVALLRYDRPAASGARSN
jgi:hypothetical protein